MKAFISDIHANLEALESVLEDIDKQKASEIICLGDIVGYGPDPVACANLVIDRAGKTILGNHDFAVLHGPVGFNRIAAEAIWFTQQIMKGETTVIDGSEKVPDIPEEKCMDCDQRPKCVEQFDDSHKQIKFIQELPTDIREEKLYYVHGSPLEPTFEYLIPDKFPGFDGERVLDMFSEVDWLAFCGHTHYPCVIDKNLNCHYPSGSETTFQLEPDNKYIINVGSVGQPRDRDNRACYLLFDEENKSIEWRRVIYDVDTVVDKIQHMCGLDNWCGERLKYGR